MVKNKNSKKQAQTEERKMIEKLAGEERVLKWGLIGAFTVLLLLILFMGYATDWTSGLNKDSATTTTPVATNLDSATTPSEEANNSTTPNNTTSNGGTPTTNVNRTNNNGTNTTNTERNNTSTSSEKSTTTTNNTTTTNTTTTPATQPSGLVTLYADTSIGDNINDVLNQAKTLGVAADCHDELLITSCTFTVGSYSVTTKNLLGTGILTSVISNL